MLVANIYFVISMSLYYPQFLEVKTEAQRRYATCQTKVTDQVEVELVD